MMVTLVICTYNRCESLKDTLASLVGQRTDHDLGYEIVVVDNGSQDETRKVVESFMGQFNGRLVYFFESRKGKPYAMNLGIKQAKGDIIAFTDDDCIIDDAEFILNIARAFRQQGAKIGFIGGKILPKWVDGEAPQWMRESLMGPLALLDYGQEAFVVDIHQPDFMKKLFYGANLAFRRELLEKHGGINVEKTLAQDTDICLRMLKADVKGFYAPTVKVLHKVPASRLTPQYFYQWFYKRGIYREDDEQYQRKAYHLFGVPFWLITQTGDLFIKSLVSRSIGDRIHYRCWAYFNWGRMVKLSKNK